MEVEALIRKNTGVLRGSCTLKYLLARVIGKFLVWLGDGELRHCNLWVCKN